MFDQVLKRNKCKCESGRIFRGKMQYMKGEIGVTKWCRSSDLTTLMKYKKASKLM